MKNRVFTFASVLLERLTEPQAQARGLRPNAENAKTGRLRSRFWYGLLLAFSITGVPVRAGDGDVEAIMKMMPADVPLSAVVVNFEKFDKNVIAFGKAVSPQSEGGGMLADLKDQLGVAEWIDFSKPVGMVQSSLQGGEPILWATIPKFADKAKALPNAKEEEGVWLLPFEGKQDLYAVVKGDIVITGSDKTALMSAVKKEGKTVADELKSRMDLLANRDAIVHLNFEPVRAMALGGIAQAAQMAPMFAMMAGQQGGVDPTAMAAAITGLIDGVKTFLEQAAYVDFAIGISGSAADATIVAGFNDGAIKSYLAKNKPASAALLAGFEEQPFTLAMGWHVPGTESPFFDYLFDKMSAAIPAPAAKPAGDGAAPGGDGAPAVEKSASAENDAIKEATQISRDLYRKIEGQNLLMTMSSKGLTSKSYYLGEDTKSILDLAKKTMTKVNPLAKSFSGGVSYEVGESKKLGGVTVDQFVVKLDASHPASAQAAKMFGDNLSILMGVGGGHVAFYMGSDADAQKFFEGKVEKPLISGRLMSESLKALPEKRNAVLLLDPAGVLPALAPLMGMPAMQEVPPGPPIGVSVLLSGDYARADVHVPARAIERVIQATSPQPPM